MRIRVHERPGPVFLCAFLCIVVGCDRKGSEAQLPRGALAGQNLLLVTLDTTRADRLGCYGYSAAETPTLDGLAKHGVLFERAYSQVPITLPSHCSIMTGRYPKELGVQVNGRKALSTEATTLAEVFRKQGYATAAFVASFVLDSRFGLDQGFDSYDDDFGSITLEEAAFQWQRPADQVTDAALAWLANRNEQQPFFAWVHYYDPHEPYAAPASFASRHPDAYDAEIAFMDAQLGRLVEGLRKGPGRERTMVVVVGDHGESLGGHGIYGHAIFLYDDVLHVPLIMCPPAAIAGGRREKTVVEAAAIFPTLLELFGLISPDDLLTRSVADALRGKALAPQAAYSESLYAHSVYGLAQQRSLITNDYKYISSTEPELYRLDLDPQEARSLLSSQADVARRLAADLQARYEAIPVGEGADVAVDATAKAGLASLGYIQGEAHAIDEFLTPGLDDPKAWIPRLDALARARALMVANRFEEAVPLWEELAQAEGNSAEILAGLGTCYLHLRNHERAKEALNKAIQADSENQLGLISMGDLFVEQGDLPQAEKYYRIAAASAAPNPQVFMKLGDLLLRMGEPGKAIEHYRETLGRYDRFAAAHARLAALLLQQGATTEAVEHLQKTAQLAPADALVRQQLGRALYQLGAARARAGQNAEAAAAFEQALQADPSLMQAAEQLSGYYLQTGKTGEAVRVLRLAVENGGDGRARFVLANLLATSNDDSVRNGAEAAKWAEQALSMSQAPRPADLAIVAAAHAEAGEFDKAVEVAGRALEAARAAGDAQLVTIIEGQIQGYRAHKPFRHPKF